MRIKTKILGTLLGMSLLVTLMGALAVNRQKAAAMESATKEAEDVAYALSLGVLSDSGQLDPAAQEIVERLHTKGGRDVALVDIQKRVLADANPASVGETYIEDQHDEVAATIRDGIPRRFVEISDDAPNGTKQIVAQVQSNSGQVLGAVILEYGPLYEELMRATRSTIRQLVAAGSVSIAIAFLIAFYMGQSIAKPIEQLRRAVMGFAEGRMDFPMPPARQDEMGDLAMTFQHMMEKRQRAEADLQRLQEELEARVAERTDELAQANTALNLENAERRRSEEALRESELRFREMTEHIQKVFWMATPFGEKLIYISPAYEQVWGRTCASLHAEPKSWIDGIVAEDRPMVVAALGRNANGETYEIEYRVSRPDGSQRWVRDRGFPVFDHDGKVVRVCGIVEDITDRRAADAELRRLSRAVEQSPVSIVITDAACNIQYVNPKFVEITGYAAEEVLGKNPRILNSGQTPRQVYVELWAALKAGREWRGEFLNRRKDGELLWELATISALRDTQGVTTHFVAVKEDITALKTAEAELRWKTAVHEAHLNSSLDGILIVDEQGKKILQNRRFGELWKIPQEILDQDDDTAALQYAMSTTVHPERFYERVKYLYSHPDETARDEIVCKDGTILDRYSSPVRDRGGKHYGRIWIFRDITERKRAEAQRERMAALVEASPDFIGFADPKTTQFQYINKYGRRMCGIGEDEDVGKLKISDVHPAWMNKRLAEVIVPAVLRDGIWEGEGAFLRRDGHEIPVSMSLLARKTASGEVDIFHTVSRDITGRKKAEAETEALNKQLVNLSRQAGMAEVASNVLHNVGNVLNSVNTSIDIANRTVRQLKAASLGRVAALLSEHAECLPAFFAEHPQGIRLPKFLAQLAGHFTTEQQTVLGELASLRGNVEHINEIVAMQQNYAGAGGIVEVMPLAEVVETALRLNTASFERHGTRVVCELDPALPPVAIDRNKLLLILINLVRNAKYACDEGGAADKRITVRAQLNGGGCAKISVSDNGIGIPPANLTRIFEHGFTTRKSGHGFGLHSSALAASEMGGSLHAHSDGPGRGATFTVELPLQPTNL